MSDGIFFGRGLSRLFTDLANTAYSTVIIGKTFIQIKATFIEVSLSIFLSIVIKIHFFIYMFHKLIYNDISGI